MYDLASALEAIDQIEEQGEGLTPKDVWDGDRDMFHPEVEEVAHYFRYQEILLGRLYQRGDTPKSGPTGRAFTIDWDAVYPMRDNPRTSDYAPGTPVRQKMDDVQPPVLGHAARACIASSTANPLACSPPSAACWI